MTQTSCLTLETSSDDNNTGAATITVESESEDDPYWTKVKVDKLQKIGNPMEVLLSNTDFMANLENVTMFSDKEIAELARLTTLPMGLLLEDIDSMPDLESVSGTEDSEELVVVIFASANTECIKSLEKGSLEESTAVFSDKEMVELAIDEGEDALTVFDAAILVNIEGSVEGTQTELYNLGASCHMLPCCDHFKNYVPIAPKSITAADK